MLSRNLLRAAVRTPARTFRTSAALNLKLGDKLPSVELQESTPSHFVNLAKETAQGKHIVIGVPGAFSPACSGSHVPGYVKALPDLEKKGIKNVYVIAVNDAFVTKAWSDNIGISKDSKVRILADPYGTFTNELGMSFDASKFFGNSRSKRYALIVEDGKVTQIFAEPDNVGVDVSAAQSVLEKLNV
ncbi:peroxiredoxin Ahp1p [Trichomonascus vanleenenianus]|uniref:peroxiredoxin family protein n=1 Tax=Trichomonascus vanleenenianus TaxID=2268995 RepID=UPI003ECB7A36